MQEDFEELHQLAAHLQDVLKHGYDTIRPLAAQIISGEITDQDEIDHIMDSVLSFIDYEPVRDLFFQCCEAIRKNDPVIADEYMVLYRNLCSTDDGENDV